MGDLKNLLPNDQKKVSDSLVNLKVFKLHCMCLRVCACALSSGDNVVLSFHYGGSSNHSGFQV